MYCVGIFSLGARVRAKAWHWVGVVTVVISWDLLRCALCGREWLALVERTLASILVWPLGAPLGAPLFLLVA